MSFLSWKLAHLHVLLLLRVTRKTYPHRNLCAVMFTAVSFTAQKSIKRGNSPKRGKKGERGKQPKSPSIGEQTKCVPLHTVEY